MSSNPRWNVRLFTDDTLPSLIAGSGGFDCVVFAENAIDQSRTAASVLCGSGFPSTNIVLLYQNKIEPAYGLAAKQ
jgi:hypothetical protein